MKIFRWLLLLVFLAPLPFRAADDATSGAEAEPSAHQKLYYLQHRLLPQWTHQSEGAFYADMREGRTERLLDACRQIAGDTIAAQLKVEKIEAPEGVLFTFAAPEAPTDCYFVFLAKGAQGCRYFTYEKAEDITGEGLVACIGEWAAEGGHRNFGFSKEPTREAFLKAVAGLLNDPSAAPGAVTHPGTASQD